MYLNIKPTGQTCEPVIFPISNLISKASEYCPV